MQVNSEMRDGREMVGHFLGGCPNVRSLSVYEDHGEWASAFAEQFERPEVVSNNDTCAIPKYCPSLLRSMGLMKLY